MYNHVCTNDKMGSHTPSSPGNTYLQTNCYRQKKHTHIRVLCVLNTRKSLRRNTQPLIK